jgi:hypothetical protein
MMKAIANPSSVVCTVSPLEGAPPHPDFRGMARRFVLSGPDSKSDPAATPKSLPEQ